VKDLAPNQSIIWDGRFRVSLTTSAAAQFTVKRLTESAWSGISDGAGVVSLPAHVRDSLPALFDASGLAALPHAGYTRPDIVTAGGLNVEVTCISGAHTTCDAEL
jgi:tRNA(Ile)-lysidine synthase